MRKFENEIYHIFTFSGKYIKFFQKTEQLNYNKILIFLKIYYWLGANMPIGERIGPTDSAV